MCGIFAVLSRGAPIREDFSSLLEMIAHRGPDGCGSRLVDLRGGLSAERREARAWLGHRRLSIIDPEPRSNQPMASDDGRFELIFNGEIYNYIELREECRAEGWGFHTNSDTEVLLACWALWGEAAISKLVGMFAFILIDREIAKAWLVRDPFGIKPLHYSLTAGRLLACSEIPPLLASNQIEFKVDPTQAVDFIRFGASNNLQDTLIESIKRVPPGTFACFDFAKGDLGPFQRYWALTEDKPQIKFDDAVAECRERFLRNIRLHLRSDVPVGAALSGGLDSSAIVCAVHHLEPDLRLKTFSFISSEPGQSEERWVDIVNAHVNSVPHKVRPNPGDLSGDLDQLILAQGEPFASASIYAQRRIFKEARSEGVPVTLDGQGADEMLAGYWPFVGTYAASLLRMGRIDRVLGLFREAGDNLRSRISLAAQIGQSAAPPSFLTRYRRLIGRTVLPDFFDSEFLSQEGIDENAVAEGALGTFRDLGDHLKDSTFQSSLPTLLRIADRSSMAYSIESRVPFLTHDFADFLLSLPPEFHISRSGERKHLFREAMRGILPEPIRARRDKIGFFADDGVWLRENWSSFQAYLPELEAIPVLNPQKTHTFLKRFRDGDVRLAQQVWRIFIFLIWNRNMRQLAQ